jgi:hypothetical protein
MSEAVSCPLRVADGPAYVPPRGRAGGDWAYLLYSGPVGDRPGRDRTSRGDFAREVLVSGTVVAFAASCRSRGFSRPRAAAAS